jgi:hypothetical protein
VIYIAGLNEVGRPIHRLAVALPVFVRNTTRISFGAMTINLDLVSLIFVEAPVNDGRVSMKPIVAENWGARGASESGWTYTHIFPGIWICPAELVMTDTHHVAVFAMQFSQTKVLCACPYFDM